MIASEFAQSTLAGTITAIAGVLTALAVLIGALTVFLPVLRATKRTEKKVDQVHTMVNQQATDSKRYQEALVRALLDAGISVPIDQSIPAQPAPPTSTG